MRLCVSICPSICVPVKIVCGLIGGGAVGDFVFFTLSPELLCGKRETGLEGKNPNLTVVAAVIFTKIEPVQLKLTKLRSSVFCGL